MFCLVNELRVIHCTTVRLFPLPVAGVIGIRRMEWRMEAEFRFLTWILARLIHCLMGEASVRPHAKQSGPWQNGQDVPSVCTSFIQGELTHLARPSLNLTFSLELSQTLRQNHHSSLWGSSLPLYQFTG